MKIVTDESTIIPEDLRKVVEMVQLRLTCGKKDYTGASYEEILNAIEEGKYFKTGMPSPASFLEVYRKYKDEKIISVHVSSKISGVINSALTASKMAKKEGINVIVVDSKSAGPACGMGIIKGIKYFEEKKRTTIQKVAKVIEESARKSYAVMAVPESHRLIKIRPIEGLKRFFKNPDYFVKFLRSKGGFPVLALLGEGVHIIEFAKEKSKALEYMFNFLKKNAEGKKISIMYFYSTEKRFIYDLEEIIEQNFEVKEKWVTRMTPLTLSAVGRYAFGFSFYINE